LQERGVDGRMILKLILNKLCVCVRACEDVNWIIPAQDSPAADCCEQRDQNSGSMKDGKFIDRQAGSP
jgi:hypothetical protein